MEWVVAYEVSVWEHMGVYTAATWASNVWLSETLQKSPHINFVGGHLPASTLTFLFSFPFFTCLCSGSGWSGFCGFYGWLILLWVLFLRSLIKVRNTCVKAGWKKTKYVRTGAV